METYIATFISSYLLLAIAVSAGFGLLAGWLAKQRGRSAGNYFALSFFCSFLIAIIVLLALPNLNPASTSAQTSTEGLEKCPNCAEMINSEAIVCRFCQRDVSKEFAARRAAHAKETKIAEQKRIAQETLEAESNAALAIEEYAARKVRSRRTWKVIALVTLAVVAYGVTQTIIGREAYKQRAAEAELAKEKEISSSVQAFLANAGFKETLDTCKSQSPSGDLISSSVSKNGQTLKIKYRLSENIGDEDGDVYGPTKSLAGFIKCVNERVIPQVGRFKGTEFIYDRNSWIIPLENMDSILGGLAAKNETVRLYNGKLVVFGSTTRPNSGPFEITVQREKDFEVRVATLLEEVLQ